MAQQQDDSGGKSWDRLWSTEEMRKNADNWSLAADVGLLKHLQQFSQDVLSHTHSTEKALDSLYETLNTTTTNINNVTNDFLCLANTQFLESRVYDDDDVDSPQEVPAANAKQESGGADLMTKVKSALSVGINLLDTMFDQVDPNSGVENDYLAGLKSRSPKSPYLARPLPHLIGSTAFMTDDNVGLLSSEKDIEQPSAKVPAMDDLSMYSDESVLTSSAKRNNMDDDSSNTSFCLGDDTPVQNKKPSRDAVSVTGPENDAIPVTEEKSFADELAGKLSNMLLPESREPPPLHNEQRNEEQIPQNRPSKKKGDMFGIPPSDDEDDALFSGRSGLFSGGRGLFDDLDDKDVVKEKVNSSTLIPPPLSKPKIDNDLFGSTSADEDNDDLFAVSAKKEPPKQRRQPDAPAKPLSIGDVISQAARRNVNAAVPVTEKGNTPGKPAETVHSVPDSVPPPIITTDKKVPTGGRSMFGSAGLPIPKEALRRRPSSSSSEGSDNANKNDKIVPNSGGGLFSPSSADEDDLFQSPATSISQTPSAPPLKPAVKKLTPRSPSEDDLFATPKSSDSSIFKNAESKPQSAPKTNNSRGLFDAEGSSDEDNLCNPRPVAKQSLFSAVPPPLTKSDEKNKKVSLFDDSDSGDDEFLFSSASSAGSRRSQASADIFNTSLASVATDKKPLRKGLFDDDSLFSSHVDGPDVDIFRGVGKDGNLGTTNKTASLATSGVSSAVTVTSTNPVDTTTKTVNPVVISATTVPAVASSATASSVTSKSSASTKTVSSVASSASSSATTTNSVRPAVAARTKAVTSIPTSAAPASSTTTVNSASPAVSSSATSSVKTTVPPPSSVRTVASSSAAASGSTKSSPAVKTVPLQPSLIGDSLFDDDEDLFSVSKPPPLEKPTFKDIPPPINKSITDTTEDLFSGLDSQTKDIHFKSEDLFADLSEDDLFTDSKISSRITSKFDNNPKVPVDDLFGTDEGDEDIFVPRKPTLTISDPIIENLETVEKVVSTTSTPKPELKPDIKPDLKPIPPRTLDVRNTTDPNVVSSFDDEEGEDLFKPLPVENKPVPPDKPPERNLKQEPVQDNEPQVVEQLKSVPVPREKPPVPTARGPTVPASEDEGAKTMKPRSPETLPKPAARTSLPKDEDKATAKLPAVQPPPIKARTPLAGLGLNINPLALLPGAQPPSTKTPGEEPVGFDQPMENTSTLHSAQKERVRGSKRRPPSRRARLEAAKVVDHTGIEITSPSSVLSPSTDEDDLFGVPQDLPPDSRPWPFDGAPILSPADPKLVPENVPVDSKAVDDPLLKMRAETSSETDTDADVADDHSSLFAFVKKKPKEPQPESLFSQAPTLPTKDDVETVKTTLTDEDVEDDDLFKPSASVKKMTDLGTRSKTWKLSDDDDDDDLFTTGVPSSKIGIVNSTKELPKVVQKEEQKPSLKTEPFAASESSKVQVSQPPPKKTERSLFDDDDDDLDDDDLFSSRKPPPLPVSKGPAPVQKKVANSSHWEDDLFDDPLSGR